MQGRSDENAGHADFGEGGKIALVPQATGGIQPATGRSLPTKRGQPFEIRAAAHAHAPQRHDDHPFRPDRGRGEDRVRADIVVAAKIQRQYGLTGKVLKWPERAEIDTPVSEQLIVELYSK